MKRFRLFALLLCAVMLLSACSRLTAAIDAFMNNGQDSDSDIDLIPDNEFAISGEDIPIYQYQDGQVSVIDPDGQHITVVIPNGGQQPDTYYPLPTTPVTAEPQVDSRLVGSWVAYQASFLDENGCGGGSGLELYLCENGYGVLESSDGEIFEYRYAGNYSHVRIYGEWRVSGDRFIFTTTENWLYDDSESIGQTMELPLTFTQDSFCLGYSDATWTFQTQKDWNSYMDIIRNANGGSTGNDMVGTRNVEDSGIDGLVGYWKMFEEKDGRMVRHLFHFEGNGNFSYFRHYVEQQGGTWVATEVVDPYIDMGAYYILNDEFTIAWGPYEVGGLTVTVSGDTMTMSTTGEYFLQVDSGTFTRYDGSDNPQP